jgi:hypothetical protein
MREALIAHQYPPAIGGVERHVAELAAGFTARGIEVEVVTCDPTQRMPALAVEDGVVVHRFPTVANDAVFFVSPSLGAWLLRNARRFSLLHAHSYHTPLALQALIAARVARRPFVLTPHYHGTGHSFVRRALHVPYRVVGRAIVRRSGPLICVSEAERALLQRHFGHDLEAVIAPNGVDVDEILRAQPLDIGRRRTLILTAGRLGHYKQVDRVVEAMPRLPEDYELVVLGTGPAQADIVERVQQLGLTDRIHHLIGTTMAVRRRDVLALGGIRSDDHGDMELSHRLLALTPGSKIIYEPAAVVHHYVPEARLSWSYFWRRCFFDNRGKVATMRGMGPAANLEAERRFVARALTRGVASGLGQFVRGDLGGLLRAGTICIGLALAGAGYAVGTVDHALRRRARITSLSRPRH